MCIIFITIISFLLEGIFSFYISISSPFLLPLPTLLSVCFCQVYFLKKKNYMWYSFIIGVLYDIAYTNTLFLHGILFVCMGYIYQKMSQFFSHTWYHFLLIIILLIGIDRVLSYMILVSIGYLHFNSSFFSLLRWHLSHGILFMVYFYM